MVDTSAIEASERAEERSATSKREKGGDQGIPAAIRSAILCSFLRWCWSFLPAILAAWL